MRALRYNGLSLNRLLIISMIYVYSFAGVELGKEGLSCSEFKLNQTLKFKRNGKRAGINNNNRSKIATKK